MANRKSQIANDQSQMTNSCLYECTVMHCRLKPKRHQFVYRLFMFYLDLDELEPVSGKLRWFGFNCFNLFSFWEKDHLSLGEPALKSTLQKFLFQNGIHTPLARVTLLTLPRVLGYVFNPVSFYFCFDSEGTPICAVAEVNNTYHETKPYLVQQDHSQTGEAVFRLRTPKFFYVSPFSGLDVDFEFILRIPQEKFVLHVNDCAGEEHLLVSTLAGQQTELTDAKLLWFSLKYPLVTLLVIFRIHFQALLLYFKKIPYHRKAANPSQQRGVFNPHHSIAGENQS